MASLLPSEGAFLAKNAYTINDDQEYEVFVGLAKNILSNPYKMTANLGGRLLYAARDFFAICACGANDYQDDLFIIFRGTTKQNAAADWVSNARAGVGISDSGSFVHNGFNEVFSSLKGDVFTFLNAYPKAQTIHCIGHSLGGAVANLCADWAASHSGKTVYLYTFGAPRVSMGPGFAQKLETALSPQNMFRVHHSNDPVPMVPVFPFTHSPVMGRDYYIPHSGLTISFGAHEMERYAHSVGSHPWGALYQPAPSFGYDAIKLWLADTYADNPHDITFWHRLNYAFLYLVQGGLSALMSGYTGAATTIDYLIMVLQKGLEAVEDARDWTVNLVKKLLRAAGMAIAEKIEEMTEQLLRMVLERLLRTLSNQVQRALDSIV